MPTQTASSPTATNPFHLFNSFSEKDALLYFGREKETAILYQLTMESDTVLIFGESGTGKTSLVQCGLINQTTNFSWTSIVIRRLDDINKAFPAQLKVHLAPCYVKESTDLSTVAVLKNVYLSSFRPVILIFDQFEELFLMGSKPERCLFYQTLEDLQQLDFPCKMIFVIRSEFLAKVNELELEQPGIFRKRLEVLPISRENALKIIIDSFRAFRIPVALDDAAPEPVREPADKEISDTEKAIAGNILDTIAPDNTTIQLPYLQAFQSELWQYVNATPGKNGVITPEAIKWLAGKGNVLRFFLDNRIEQQQHVSKEDSWKVLKLFLSDTQGIKKHVTQSDFDSIPADNINGLREHFRTTGVIREVSKDIFELAHECLVPVIESVRFSSLRNRLEEPTILGNPYKGLVSYTSDDEDLFYGRTEVIQQLMEKVTKHPFVVVVGNSGVGKSSLIKAGIFPALDKKVYNILRILRAGEDNPLKEINAAVREANPEPDIINILLIDQYEELRTRISDDKLCQNVFKRIHELVRPKAPGDTRPVIRVIVTIRADFEPQFSVMEPLRTYWKTGKFIVPPFTREEICQVIEEPAYEAGLLFSPPSLTEQIADDVYSSQTTGLLPLMSFCLRQLYDKYEKRGANDYLLLQSDYDNMGGVIGALQSVAEEIYTGFKKQFPKDYVAYQDAVRNITLRMVYSSAGELAGQRVLEQEFVYDSPERNERVAKVLKILEENNLIVSGHSKGGQKYYEPAHDVLVKTWSRIWDWINDSGKDILNLQSRLRLVTSRKADDKRWDIMLPQPEVLKEVAAGWMNQQEQQFVERHMLYKKQRANKEKARHQREIEMMERLAQAKSRKYRTIFAICGGIILLLAYAGWLLYSSSIELKAASKEKDAAKAALEIKQLEVTKQRDQARDSGKIARQQIVVASTARDSMRIEKMAAERATSQANRALRSLKVVNLKLILAEDSLNSALAASHLNNIKLQNTIRIKDSLANATKVLTADVDEKNTEGANRLIQLAKIEEPDNPEKSYRLAQLAVKQDTNNIAARRYLDSLYKKPLFYPIIIRQGDFASFSPDGENYLIASSREQKLWIFRVNSKEPFDSVHIDGGLVAAEFQKDGKVVMLTHTNKVVLRKTNRITNKNSFGSIIGDAISYACISPDESMALVIDDGILQLYDLTWNNERFARRYKPIRHEYKITHAAFSKDSKTVIAGTEGGGVLSITTKDGKETIIIKDMYGQQAFLSPTANYFLTSTSAKLTLMNPERKQKWEDEKSFSSKLAEGALFSSDGKWLILNYARFEGKGNRGKSMENLNFDNRSVQLVPITCDECDARFNSRPFGKLLPTDISGSNFISFYNNKLFLGRPDNSILYTNVETQKQYRLPARPNTVTSLSPLNNGTRIITVYGNEVVFWQLTTLEIMNGLKIVPQLSGADRMRYSINAKM